MATISKRSSNQFNVRIRHTGYPIRSKTFSTREEAALWAATIENEIRRGVYQRQQPEAERTTLHAALSRYADEVTPLKKSADSELCRVAAWQRNPLAQKFLGSLRGTDFAKYRDTRLAAGTAGNTIRLDLAVISHLFEVARKDWGMESLSNPVKNVRKPKLARGRDRRLLEGEEVKLLDSCMGNQRLRAVIQLALATGMRRGELVKLRWCDIDLDTCVLKLMDTKNGTDREVPLSTSVVSLKCVYKIWRGCREFHQRTWTRQRVLIAGYESRGTDGWRSPIARYSDGCRV